ncbi:MAG: type VI secretion system tube protein Hcp [Thermoguttaceae bacterium]
MQGIARKRIRAIWFGLAILAGILFFAATPAFAAEDYYLKLEGVTGESKEIHHVGWIVLLGYDMNAANSSPTSAGGGAGKTVESMNITKRTDNTSNILFAAVAKGSYFKDATIDVVKAGDPNHLVISKFLLRDVRIVAFHQSAASSGQVDTITLQFTSMTTVQVSQSPDGKVATPQVATKYSNVLRKDVGAKILKPH